MIHSTSYPLATAGGTDPIQVRLDIRSRTVAVRGATGGNDEIKIVGHFEFEDGAAEVLPFGRHVVEDDVLIGPDRLRHGVVLVEEHDVVVTQLRVVSIGALLPVDATFAPVRELAKVFKVIRLA